ncbi:MAG TPA: LysM peptidoglycan-binding domain-containing protein [Candidatus Limnocylindria bacterium]
MQRLRPLVAVGSIAGMALVAPVLAAVAIGADPVVVRPGDTLSAISMRSGISVERLVDLNDIDDPNRIFVGQRLRISADAPTPNAGGAVTSHVVEPGESLWGIARHYGTTIAAIASANGLADPSRIFGGQRLAIPGHDAAPAAADAPAESSAPPAAAPARPVVHTVARGESVWSIAVRYGTTVGAIASANGLADPSRIFGGQRLAIPGATGSAPSKPAATPRMPPSMADAVSERDAVRRMIVEEAERHGVHAALALAVAWQESGWRQGVVSYAGAVGVMQLLPSTAEWVGDTMLGVPVDLHDARSNIRAGVRLIAHYLDRYEGNVDLALAAYYQGQTAADRHGVYTVSRPYVSSIRALVRIFGG